MDLFINPTLEFEKSAAEVVLPEDPNAWPQEILQEAFKQAPYISDFEPQVIMDRVEGERGYAFGHIEVSNKTSMSPEAGGKDKASVGVQQVRIPIVVKDRRLQPLDVLVTPASEMLPLTEARLRQAIFRPQAFDIAATSPGDQSMISQLYPPFRQNYGFGGGGATVNAGMGKEGSVAKKMVDAVSGSLRRKSWNPRLMRKSASLLESAIAAVPEHIYQQEMSFLQDPSTQAALVKNAHATTTALRTLQAYTPPVKVAEDIKPSVVQLIRDGGSYTVKSASVNAWQVNEQNLDRPSALSVFGSKVVLAADLSGSATLGAPDAPAPESAGAPPSVPEEPEADQPELVSQFGMYKVQDTDGRDLVGYCFPNLLDLDGTSLPLTLFTNGSQAAMQGEVAGIPVGTGASLFEGPPGGHGCFYEVLSNGRAQATIPLTIEGGMSGDGMEASLSATTFDGRTVQVMVQPNIGKVMLEGDHLLVPETMRWLPLDKAESVTLVSAPAEFNKQASFRAHLESVYVRAGGVDSFSFSGVPVEKLASEDRAFLNVDDALFLLTGLGVGPAKASEKLAEAMRVSSPIAIKVARVIRLPEPDQEPSEDTVKVAHEMRRSLFKEAAVIPDPMAVDTVLSLGFVCPENVHVFMSYLPELDASQKKMCELLLASRLGLREVPQGALEKAIRATEEVLEGLKVLAFSSTN